MKRSYPGAIRLARVPVRKGILWEGDRLLKNFRFDADRPLSQVHLHGTWERLFFWDDLRR